MGLRGAAAAAAPDRLRPLPLRSLSRLLRSGAVLLLVPGLRLDASRHRGHPLCRHLRVHARGAAAGGAVVPAQLPARPAAPAVVGLWGVRGLLLEPLHGLLPVHRGAGAALHVRGGAALHVVWGEAAAGALQLALE